MPAKNSSKQYSENSYYHIYNRGVEKRIIFMDDQDYGVFLSYLKEYLSIKDENDLRNKLSDPNISYKEKDKILKLLRLNNFFGEIILLAYCLMPNHFHFLIKQNGAQLIDKFMNSLATRYTMYFNRKYKRVGTLYQGVYKAVIVDNDEQLIHLTKYIHQQAIRIPASQGEALQGHQPCSFPDYLNTRKTAWVKPDVIMTFFSKINPSLSYKSFVEEQDDLDVIKDLILDV